MLPLPQGDTAAREGWGEGTIHHKPPRHSPHPQLKLSSITNTTFPEI